MFMRLLTPVFLAGWTLYHSTQGLLVAAVGDPVCCSEKVTREAMLFHVVAITRFRHFEPGGVDRLGQVGGHLFLDGVDGSPW